MNWCLAASCAICIPVLFFYKENYRRLDIDTIVTEVNEIDPEINGDIINEIDSDNDRENLIRRTHISINS